MPKVLFLASVIGLLCILHSNRKWRFMTGIFVGVLCIAFYERIEPLGSVIVYGAIAIVLWFYSARAKKDDCDWKHQR